MGSYVACKGWNGGVVKGDGLRQLYAILRCQRVAQLHSTCVYGKRLVKALHDCEERRVSIS